MISLQKYNTSQFYPICFANYTSLCFTFMESLWYRIM